MTLSKEQLFAIISIAEELHAISLAAKNDTQIPGLPPTAAGRSVEQSITELLFLPTLAFNKFETINSKRVPKPGQPQQTIKDVRDEYFAGTTDCRALMDEFGLNPDQQFNYKTGGLLTCAIDTGILDSKGAGEARELLGKLCATNFMAKKVGAAVYGGPACKRVLELLANLGKVIDNRP